MIHFTSKATRPPRILDFDTENSPLTYWAPDRPTARLTAIAWMWADEPGKVECRLIGRDDEMQMLLAFRSAYVEADILTAHYLRRHDLPLLNGALLEMGLPGLPPRLTIDTKMDYVRRGDLPATQEFISDMLGVKAPKIHQTQSMWRESNKFTAEGLALTEARVVGDVLQHHEMRLEMTRLGLLKPPKVWRP